MNLLHFINPLRQARVFPLWLLILFAIALTLALSLGAPPAHAAIVDVSGIEVPPVGDPVCAYCDGAGCDQCQPSSDPDPDPGSDSDPDLDPTPVPKPDPQPDPATIQPQPTPVDPAVQRREQFEREKTALMEEFAIPANLQGFTSSDAPDDTDAIHVDEDTIMGVGSVPTGLGQPGGLSAQEWKKAGEWQRQLDELHAKWPLSTEEIAYQEQLEAKRNSLWQKAVGVPGLTAEERDRLRLKFHVAGQRLNNPPPLVTSDAIGKLTKNPVTLAKDPTSSAPVPDKVNPVSSYLLKEFLINRPTAGIEYVGQEIADTIIEDSPFGNVLGVAKIAVAYKTEGQASARAATADFLVGLIPYPQASFAVDGGRVYAKVTFQAMNKFMTDAMNAVGGDFDKEKFWSELKNESDNGMKGLMEWIGNGAD